MRAESAPEHTPAEGIFLARPEPLPTEGITLAVKDLFDTAGLTTTYGSVVFADHVPERSAEAVVRIEAAGYVDIGKTNLHEFAYGITSQNPHYGTVPNPVAPGRTAGGSSGGSAAALAAGLADAALGTDSGGSIRIPAACCAVVGFKPTFGLVPVDGVFPLAPTFDHAGPMAQTVAACTNMMEALVPGFEATDEEGFTVGIAWLEHCDPPVAARVREAAAALTPQSVDFPLLEGVGPMFMREVAEVHRDLYAEHRELYGANVGGKVERCLAVTDAEYEGAVPTISSCFRSRARSPNTNERSSNATTTASKRKRPSPASTCSSSRRSASSRRPLMSTSSPSGRRPSDSRCRSTRSDGRRCRCPWAPPGPVSRHPSRSSADRAPTRSCSPPAARSRCPWRSTARRRRPTHAAPGECRRLRRRGGA